MINIGTGTYIQHPPEAAAFLLLRLLPFHTARDKRQRQRGATTGARFNSAAFLRGAPTSCH